MIRPVRPLGVVILTVLQVISGIGDVFIGILLLFRSLALGVPGGGLVADAFLLLGILAFALGTFSFVLAYGLWSGKGWAWSLSIIGATIGLVLGVLGLVVSGLKPESITDLIPIILSVLVLAYLYTSSVRAYFCRPAGIILFRPAAPPVVAQPYPPMGQPPYPPPAIQQPHYPQPQQGPAAQPAPWAADVCPNCATTFQPGANFCDRCGTRLR